MIPCDVTESYQLNVLSSIWNHKEQVCVYLQKSSIIHIKARSVMDLYNLNFKGIIHMCTCIHATAKTVFLKLEEKGQSNSYYSLGDAD